MSPMGLPYWYHSTALVPTKMSMSLNDEKKNFTTKMFSLMKKERTFFQVKYIF